MKWLNLCVSKKSNLNIVFENFELKYYKKITKMLQNKLCKSLKKVEKCRDC